MSDFLHLIYLLSHSCISDFSLQTVVKLETAWWALAEMPEQNRKESIQVGSL